MENSFRSRRQGISAHDAVDVLERKESGLLGAEFVRTDKGYRVSKIFPGQNWSEEFRSPFLDAGVDIQLGDVITAIDGKRALEVKNFYQLLEGKGGRGVEIERVRNGDSKRVQVKTIVAETNLRYLDWIQTRSALVTKLSNGRIGYVHLPNTAIEGNHSAPMRHLNLAREFLNAKFLPQVKDGCKRSQ